MAFAFGFPQNVTDLIYSMRDWRWEMVRNGGKTPSARCLDNILVCVGGIREYQIVSDIEDSDYGELVEDSPLNKAAWIRIYSINQATNRIDWTPLRRLELRRCGGPTGKFRRLQKQNDRRVNETWWQCEPCSSAAATRCASDH